MFFGHYRLKQPKGLSAEQELFWKEEFCKALEGVKVIRVETDDRGGQVVELLFADTHEQRALAAGEWFITKLMMDPVTRETGPCWNQFSSYPRLVTIAGEFAFYLDSVGHTQRGSERAMARIDLRLYPLERRSSITTD